MSLRSPLSPYVGWSKDKKKRFLRLLIKIARENTLHGYASMVQTKAWDTLLDNETKLGLPKVKNSQLVEDPIYNPYLICFQNFFAKFPQFLNKVIDPIVGKRKPAERVAFVFHQHEAFGPAALVGYTIVNRELDYDHRLGTIAFGSTEDYPPLQAADLFAFYCRRRFTRYLNDVPPDEFEVALIHPDKSYLMYLSTQNLLELREDNEELRREREKANASRKDD